MYASGRLGRQPFAADLIDIPSIHFYKAAGSKKEAESASGYARPRRGDGSRDWPRGYTILLSEGEAAGLFGAKSKKIRLAESGGACLCSLGLWRSRERGANNGLIIARVNETRGERFTYSGRGLFIYAHLRTKGGRAL